MAGAVWAAAMEMYSSGIEAPRRKLKADRAWSSTYPEEDIFGVFCFYFLIWSGGLSLLFLCGFAVNLGVLRIDHRVDLLVRKNGPICTGIFGQAPLFLDLEEFGGLR